MGRPPAGFLQTLPDRGSLVERSRGIQSCGLSPRRNIYSGLIPERVGRDDQKSREEHCPRLREDIDSSEKSRYFGRGRGLPDLPRRACLQYLAPPHHSDPIGD